MKYITIPEDIQIADIQGQLVIQNGEPLTLAFVPFFLERLNDRIFAESMDGILRVVKMRSDCVGLQPGNVLEIEDADFTKVCAAVKRPSNGYNPNVAHNLVPFMHAIVDAPSEKPE